MSDNNDVVIGPNCRIEEIEETRTVKKLICSDSTEEEAARV